MKRSYMKYFAALLLFGFNGIVASFIDLSSYEIVLLRTFIGSVLLIALFFLTRNKLTFYQYKNDSLFLLFSGIAMGTSWMFLYEAYAQIGVSIASLCYYCGPIIVMALSPLLFREKLTASKLCGFAAVLIGIILVNGSAFNGNGNLWGIFCGLMSVVMYAAMVICNKKAQRITEIENATLQLFVSFLTVFIFVLFKQGLCKALMKYDISIAPFLPYAQRYMEREAHNYIRTMRTGYYVQSEFEYARLRKVMDIFNHSGGEFTEETISQVAMQIGESYEKTKSIIEGGILTENYTDVQSNDEDDAGTTNFLLPDSSLNPENIYFKQELYDKLYEAFDNLEYTEKIMLAQHLGFCPDCFSTRYADKNDLEETGKPKEKPIKPLPYTDIATDHGFSDASTAKRVCKRAIDKLIIQIDI